MKLGVEHIGLAAKNTALLRDFYVNVLGGEVLLENPPAYFVRLAPGLIIEIYEGDFSLKETSDNSLHGWRHLALRVDSIADARVELERRGVTNWEQAKPAGGGGRVLFFRDPEGNILHLVERPVDSIFKSPL